MLGAVRRLQFVLPARLRAFLQVLLVLLLLLLLLQVLQPLRVAFS